MMKIFWYLLGAFVSGLVCLVCMDLLFANPLFPYFHEAVGLSGSIGGFYFLYNRYLDNECPDDEYDDVFHENGEIRMQVDYSQIKDYDLCETIRDAMEFGIDELVLTAKKNVIHKQNCGINGSSMGYNDPSGEFYFEASFGGMTLYTDAHVKGLSGDEVIEVLLRTIFHEVTHAYQYQTGMLKWEDSDGKEYGKYTVRVCRWKDTPESEPKYFARMREDRTGYDHQVYELTDDENYRWICDSEKIMDDKMKNATPVLDCDLGNEKQQEQYKELPWEKHADENADKMLLKYRK